MSDVTLENVFPTLISKAVEIDDDVFLRWNGATVRVEPTDTIDTLMQKYDKEIRLVGLANKMEIPSDQRPDAAPASLSVGAVEPKFKNGDRVWAKHPKELAGRTGYVRAVDTYRMEYEVAFGTEVWKMLEDDLELVDPATEEDRQTAFERENDSDQPLTEQAAYDEYQKRSKTSGDRAEQLAWAMIALLTGQLIGGSKYAEFYVLGGAALLYLLLSAMQYVWQSVTIWLVKCRIKRTGITLNDYPVWVCFGAWVFYWLKMISIVLAAIYGASHFISFAM